MERDETRGASLVASPRTTDIAKGTTKLPLLLTARPGNVGVQIDAFRTLKLFHRPRCGKFTAQFQGATYENHSMENYSRVVERTHVRTRIVADRLEKLKQHEATLVADEQKRRQRRREREAAEQRHQWLLRQAAKKAEQREREEHAAQTLQRVVRGYIARRRVAALRDAKAQQSAATRLQTSLRAFVRKRHSARQRHERENKQRLHAATTIQRHARKRQASSRGRTAGEEDCNSLERKDSPPPSLPERVETELEAATLTTDGPDEPVEPLSVAVDVDSTDPAVELVPSLDLLLPTPSPESTTSAEHDESGPPPRSSTEPTARPRPRRPVTIKRVGGGFRQSAAFQSPRLRTSRPPDLAEVMAPRPPPPRAVRVTADHGRSTRVREDDTTVTAPRRSPSPKRPGPQSGDTDADENALLELVEQLDLAVSALVEAHPLELSLEPGSPDDH